MSEAGGFWAGIEPDAPSVRETVEAVLPPVGLLVAAGASVLVSMLLLVVGGGQAAALLGWALGSWVTVALVARFVRVDAQRRLSGTYSPRSGLTTVRLALLVTGITFAVLNAWAFATSVAAR